MSQRLQITDEGISAADIKGTTIRRRAIWAIGVAMSAFHIYTTTFGQLHFVAQRGIHLAFAATLIILTLPLHKTLGKGRLCRSKPGVATAMAVDLLLIILSWIAVYICIEEYKLRVIRAGATSHTAVLAGFFLFLLVLEISRRNLGVLLPAIAVVGVFYARYGKYLPGLLQHRGYPWERIFGFLAANPDGLFGIPLGVSATVIFLFVLLGALLEGSGAGSFINDFAQAVAGRLRSGPALAAVVASALMGTINGSAVANVVGTGTFTIPLMKKQGFRPYFAAAVEAAASTGGQILPPVMGAGAFIMVAFTEVPYRKIAVAAALPGILYFLAVGISIHLEAVKLGMKAKKEGLPNLKTTLKQGLPFLLPIVVLLYFLLIASTTPTMAALYASAAVPVAAAVRRQTRMSAAKIVNSLSKAALSALVIASGCACAGIVVAMAALTGLGVAFTDFIISLSHGNLFLALLFTAITCVILGMGLPTTAAYVIAASLAAPALTALGVPLLSAHLFVFYFACLSAITPPVALAAYAGAGIAGASPVKVGFTACGLAIAGFVVPFMFVYAPALLLKGSLAEVARATITAVLGTALLSSATEGYLFAPCTVVERAVFLVAGLGLIDPGTTTDLLALGPVALVLVFHVRRARRGWKPAPSMSANEGA